MKGRVYYAYSQGRMNGMYVNFTSAVMAAYDGMGLVTDENGCVFWNRVNRGPARTIREISGEETLARRYLSELAKGEEMSSDGVCFIDARGLSLGQVLYFVSQGKPVAAFLGDDSYGLIYGYDQYNISCLWYPGTEYAYSDKMGLNDATAFFESTGRNDFVCFLEQ